MFVFFIAATLADVAVETKFGGEIAELSTTMMYTRVSQSKILKICYHFYNFGFFIVPKKEKLSSCWLLLML